HTPHLHSFPTRRSSDLEDPAEGGKGFIVCYIPESAYKPHRTELGGAKRWMMRIGDSFVDVPPSVLRSLFHPHRHSYMFMRVNNRDRKSTRLNSSHVSIS